MARLFTGVFPPEDVRDRLSNLQSGPDGIRWTPAPNLHSTLVFIGRVPDDHLRPVREALSGVRFDPFTVRIGGTGAFPDDRTARVLWAGLVPETPVSALHDEIVDALVPVLGADCRPTRPFRPHVTVGRTIGKRLIDASEWTDRHDTFSSDPFTVDAFHLVRSRTKPQGSEYTSLAEYPAHSGLSSGSTPPV